MDFQSDARRFCSRARLRCATLLWPALYMALSVAGIISLVCGPRLYRWFGSAYFIAALLFAVGEQRAALHQTEEIQRMRASAQAQHP